MSMINKEEDEETNLQKASCMMEVGVKTSSMGVDSEHSDPCNMLGGYHINIIVSVMDSGLYWARHLMCFLAGNLVKNASFGKLKIGTARGGVPATRIAVYKLVLGSLCYGFMTRAFTAAIEDKVDILNLSIGHPNDDEKIKMRESDYFDEIELGTYKDMFRDMLSCTAAGNDTTFLKKGFSINRFGDTESCNLIYSKNARAPIGAVGI
ncbi:unnamed protein product [Camellia sinensis]